MTLQTAKGAQQSTSKGGRPTYTIETPPPGAAVLFIPDSHHTDQDQQAFDAMLSFMEKKHGGYWWASIFLGDQVDGYAMSEYPKRASALERLGGMKDEFKAFRPNAQRVCERSHINVYIKGNHELRVDKTIENAGLYGITSFESLAGLGDIENLDVVAHAGRVKVGRIVGEHGDCLRGGNSCEAIARNYPYQVSISGHTHRLASAFYTGYGESGEPKLRAAFKAGHLANPQPASGYTYDPNWQQGFIEAEFLKAGRFRITPHAIQGGEVY